MTKMETFRPFAWGVVCGAIALTVTAFSADWIVTRGTAAEDVRTAWIDGQAGICATLAHVYRKQNNIVTELQGWAGRDAREKLAKDSAIIPAGDKSVDQSVIYACSSLLDKNT